MKAKSKKRIIIAACVLGVFVAAGLGYWKRIGIPNTLMRIVGIDTSTSYGYYKQEIPVDMEEVDNLNILESDEASASYDTEIPWEESSIAQTKSIDESVTDELESGAYTWEEPLVLSNPYKISPLTGLILFQTEDAYRVRVTVKGKEETYRFIREKLEETTLHRIPVVGLYPSYDNQVVLESSEQ